MNESTGIFIVAINAISQGMNKTAANDEHRKLIKSAHKSIYATKLLRHIIKR